MREQLKSKNVVKVKAELIQSEEELAGEISIDCNESQSVNTVAD